MKPVIVIFDIVVDSFGCGKRTNRERASVFSHVHGIMKEDFGEILLTRKMRRWIGFSEDDTKGIAEGAKSRAARPQSSSQRVKATRFTRITDLRDNYSQRSPITCDLGPMDEAKDWGEV